MKRYLLILVSLFLLLVGVYWFRTELSVAADIGQVRQAQSTVCRLMTDKALVAQCLEIVETHDGDSQLLKFDSTHSITQKLPQPIMQSAPSYCMISTNSLSFTWLVGPWCFWSLEVSPQKVDLSAMKELWRENEHTKDLEIKVVDHGEHWLVTESLN